MEIESCSNYLPPHPVVLENYLPLVYLSISQILLGKDKKNIYLFFKSQDMCRNVLLFVYIFVALSLHNFHLIT